MLVSDPLVTLTALGKQRKPPQVRGRQILNPIQSKVISLWETAPIGKRAGVSWEHTD